MPVKDPVCGHCNKAHPLGVWCTEHFERLQVRITEIEGLLSMPEGEDESLYGVAQGYNSLRERVDALEGIATYQDALIKRLDAEPEDWTKVEAVAGIIKRLTALEQDNKELVLPTKGTEQNHERRIIALESGQVVRVEPDDPDVTQRVWQRLAELERWRDSTAGKVRDLMDSAQGEQGVWQRFKEIAELDAGELLHRVRDRLDSLERFDSATFLERVGDLEHTVKDGEAFDDLQATDAKTAARVEVLADRIRSLEGRMGQVTGWTGDIDDKVDALRHAVETKGGGGGLTLEERLRTTRKIQEDFAESHGEFRQRLEAIEAKVEPKFTHEGELDPSPEARLDRLEQDWTAAFTTSQAAALVRDATISALGSDICRTDNKVRALEDAANNDLREAINVGQRKRFGPAERVHLVELHMTMSLVKPNGMSIKEFWGFVTVKGEPLRGDGDWLELEGEAIDRSYADSLHPRTFAVLGERWAGIGRFEVVLAAPGRAELHVYEWRRTDDESEGDLRKGPPCQG